MSFHPHAHGPLHDQIPVVAVSITYRGSIRRADAWMNFQNGSEDRSILFFLMIFTIGMLVQVKPTRRARALAVQPVQNAVGVVHMSTRKGCHNVISVERFGTNDTFFTGAGLLEARGILCTQPHVQKVIQHLSGSA
jgi:hypothetical protein